MTNPLISIIIPSYNSSEFITKTLESVKSQTYNNWECIIINDGSTDDSEIIIRNAIKEYPNFIYHYQNNKGLSGARNTGIDLSKGDYIYFLDSDDLIETNTLESLIQLASEDIDIVFGKTATTNGQNKDIISFLEHELPTKKVLKNKSLQLIPQLLENRISCVAHNRLYKTSFLTSNKLKFKDNLLHEDELWFFETIFHSKAIILNDVPTYFYNEGNMSSITNNFKLKNTESYIQIIEYIYSDYYKKNTSQKAKEIISAYITNLKTITICHCYHFTPENIKQQSATLIAKSFNNIKTEQTFDILSPKLKDFYTKFNKVYPLGINKTRLFIRCYHSRSIIKTLKKHVLLIEAFFKSSSVIKA